MSEQPPVQPPQQPVQPPVQPQVQPPAQPVNPNGGSTPGIIYPVTPPPPVQQPVAPVQPQAPVQQPVPPQAPAQPQVPVNDIDVNQMIANIEAETQRQQTELKQKIMSEAEQKFGGQLAQQQQNQATVMGEMKAQIDALTRAGEEQKRTIVETFKTKLQEQATQLQNVEGELSQRQSNVPNEPNPYRPAAKPNEDGETLDPDQQKAELDKMYRAINGKNL